MPTGEEPGAAAQAQVGGTAAGSAAGSAPNQFQEEVNMNADFLHLFARSGVPDDIQQKFGQAGMTSLQTFSAMFESEADLRSVLKSDFQLDAANGLAERVKISKIVISWETSKGRVAKMHELEGEAETRREPKRLPMPDHKAMKEHFAKAQWALAERDTPAPRWMEKRFEMLERNDLKAECLTDVLNVLEEDDQLTTPKIDQGGNFVTIKTGSRVPLPSNIEQFRQRVHLWGTSWIMAASMHTNRPILKGLEPMVFTHYLTHMLGEHVMGLIARGPRALRCWGICG